MKMVEFIGLVDRMVEKEMGVSIYDLPDVDWHAFWFVGISEEDAKEKATDVVPNLLDDFKKRKKESNAQPISEVIGQYMAQAEPDTSTDG